MNHRSYTTASTFPAKLFCHTELLSSIRVGRIKPLHVQVNPTNQCPLNCSFCSCACRDRTAELNYDWLVEETQAMAAAGTKAITITGGGEPLAYEPLPQYIKFLKTLNISSSLTTNGVLFTELPSLAFLENLTWVRISLSDDRKFDHEEIDVAVNHATDWSFSYVLSQPDADVGNLALAIIYANSRRFTHVRVVDDILAVDDQRINRVRQELVDMGLDLSKVIWQGRKAYAKGNSRCLLSLLKPNLTPYGYYVGCCGVQFASDAPCLDWPENFSIGRSIAEIYHQQKHFNGGVCSRCYYAEYNDVLCAIHDSINLNHQDFI